jgi:hypothetical protein
MTSEREYLRSVREDNEYAARIEDKNSNCEEFDYENSEPVICRKCKVIELTSSIEKVNPVQTKSTATVDSEVFEI